MRDFEVLRYIKRWRYLIVAVCILGVVLVYQYAMSKQQYMARAVVSYTNSNAVEGMTPTGDKLDVTEIYSANVVTRVMEDLSLDIGADSIRSRCSVQPIISEEEEMRKEAILEDGEEYEFDPTDYLVTFSTGSEHDKEYVATVLDSILKNYYIVYGEKYINQTVLPNNASNLKDGSYDFIESAEILEDSVQDINDYLYSKMRDYPEFRSAATGYSFSDLYNRYHKLLSYEVPEIFAKILNQKISKDQDVLIKNYNNQISQYAISINNLQEKINPLYELINGYSSKSKEGVMYHYAKGSDSSSNSDYILKDVYDDQGEMVRVNSETTYDSLINGYVELEIQHRHTLVDMNHKQGLLNIFQAATPASDAEAAVDEINADMDRLIDKLNRNYADVERSVDEFNQYLGAQNITPLTSVSVTEKINAKMYLLIAFILFFIIGCLGAIFLGRIQDFVEYLLYVDKKTGLGNRAKCDMLIDNYASKPLNDNFCFILIRLDILKGVNSRIGRTVGDTLLGEFGNILRETAADYGFAGYNGSDQFMCIFEDCSYNKAIMFIEAFRSYIEMYNSQNPQHDIIFSYAIEESESKGIYDIRGLISAAFRDVNSNKVSVTSDKKGTGKNTKKNKEETDNGAKS